MGWTYQRREKGLSNREFFQELMGDSYEILADATIDKVFYAACRNTKTGDVSAAVILINWVRDYYNFGYKDQDERMGPCDAKAPAKVLDLLSPLEDCTHGADDGTLATYCGTCAARKWRARCRTYAAKPKAKPGDTVRFATTWLTHDGCSTDTFTYVKGPNTFRDVDAGCTFRLRGWRNVNYEVVSA